MTPHTFSYGKVAKVQKPAPCSFCGVQRFLLCLFALSQRSVLHYFLTYNEGGREWSPVPAIPCYAGTGQGMHHSALYVDNCSQLACSLIIAGTIGLTQPARRLERDCELAFLQAIPQVISSSIFSITNKKYGDLVDF